MVLLLGSVMLVIGLIAGCLLMTGAPSTTKWPVAHESEIAHSTLATNRLLEILCHSISSLSDNACGALCRIVAVMVTCCGFSITTFCTDGRGDCDVSKLLLQFDICAGASLSSLSSSSHINAEYWFTLLIIGVGICK